MELRSRGHEVVFAGESPKIKFIQEQGFDVLPIYETDPALLLDNIRKGKLQFVNSDEIERMIKADLELYNHEKPDLVLTDFRFTAPISTHIANIRHVAIVNGSSTEFRAFPFIPIFDWIPKWIIKRDSMIWEKLDLVNLELEMSIFDNTMSEFKKLSKKYGIRNTVTATNCLTGKDMTLLADIPEYFPTKNLPDNYRYIGPLTWESNIPVPSWWPPKKRNKTLVYISMGTTGISNFFQMVYKLIEVSDIVAIITTGGQAKNLGTIDEKIYVEDYIDGDLAMEACDLVVCHGGNGTINQALRQGKPVIGIPTIPDQKFNMRRVEALGIGKMLTWKAFLERPESLMKLMKLMLKEKSYYDNAQKLKYKMSSYNAAKTAADLILNRL